METALWLTLFRGVDQSADYIAEASVAAVNALDNYDAMSAIVYDAFGSLGKFRVTNIAPFQGYHVLVNMHDVTSQQPYIVLVRVCNTTPSYMARLFANPL